MSSITAPLRTPVLSVVPIRALVDETFKVLVENLSPGRPVTVRSLHHSEDRDDWEAYGHYISDHRGTVSVSDDSSFGGSYSGKEPMGLLWSMRPVPGSRPGLRLRKRDITSPLLVNISVYSGHEGFRDQEPLASVVTERWYMAPGVKRVEVKEQGIRGTLFIPPGPGPFAGLLDLWGGGGGLLEYRAALLASHGYVCLALEYLRTSEMKSGKNEQLYFEAAFNIIKFHPQVMPDRVGLFGLSMGSLISMYLAAESAAVKPRCCVCISCNHSYLPGKHITDGYSGLLKPVTSTRFKSALCQVGKISCPILLVNGQDDQNWPSVESAEDLRAAGKEHLLTRLTYPNAGHLIEPPFSPHFRATNFKNIITNEKVVMLWGGQTKPHSDAQEDSWRKILSFLQLHMYSSSSPRAKL
uniref:Acyl-CoA thioesterase 15 n=1 Tax=Echeneis naucrates TaxID=173247 RepID=A0A665UFQ6_ECHNA